MKRKMLCMAAAAVVSAGILAGCSGSASSSAQTASQEKTESGSAQAGAESGADYSWPTKNLQLICPFKAGGDSDANARWAAQYLSQVMGIDVVVTNVDGNGGAVGAREAHNAANDGSIALFSSSAFITNELSGAIDFGLDDFEFCCIAAMNPGNIICVNKDLGVTDFQGLCDYSKEHPGELTMAYDAGATTHAMALQIIDAGVDATLVDAGSSSDRIAALLGGHVDIIINAYGSVKDYLTSGDFVGLGLTGTENAEYIPDYPCLKELGYDVAFPNYFFIAFPKGTDPELVQKVSTASKEYIENNEEYAAAIRDAYMQSPTYYDTEEGLALMEEAKNTIAKYTSQFQAK